MPPTGVYCRGACLARAKAYGLKFSIEQRTHYLIPDAASSLRPWDHIRDDDRGYKMDVGGTLRQREYPPRAIHKVDKHVMNVHMRDIDGLTRMFPPIGRVSSRKTPSSLSLQDLRELAACG